MYKTVSSNIGVRTVPIALLLRQRTTGMTYFNQTFKDTGNGHWHTLWLLRCIVPVDGDATNPPNSLEITNVGRQEDISFCFRMRGGTCLIFSCNQNVVRIVLRPEYINFLGSIFSVVSCRRGTVHTNDLPRNVFCCIRNSECFLAIANVAAQTIQKQLTYAHELANDTKPVLMETHLSSPQPQPSFWFANIPLTSLSKKYNHLYALMLPCATNSHGIQMFVILFKLETTF